MKSIRELMNVVREAEQPTKIIKTVLMAGTQQGFYIKDVDVKQVIDPERFALGTAKRAAEKYNDEMYGYTTSDKKGIWTISYGEDVLVVLDSASPFFNKFDPSMEGEYAPESFVQYYDDNLNY